MVAETRLGWRWGGVWLASVGALAFLLGGCGQAGSWDDPFVVRDRISYWFMRQMMPAPREVAADLWVNGELKGAYEIEERWGRESLAGHYASPFGPIYRLRGSLSVDPYAYVGADP